MEEDEEMENLNNSIFIASNGGNIQQVANIKRIPNDELVLRQIDMFNICYGKMNTYAHTFEHTDYSPRVHIVAANVENSRTKDTQKHI